jgi:hypothetical protein
MRLAYFVTSYASPSMLLRLLGTLRRADPDAPIVVHHDRFRSTLDEDALHAIGGVHLLASEHPIVWGDMTLEAVRWRVFDRMLATLDFDWVVILSEQDYPVRPLGELGEWLTRDGADAVIVAEPLEEIADRSLRLEHRRRYLYRFSTTLPRPRWTARVPAPLRAKADAARVLAYRAVNKVQDAGRVYWFPKALALPPKVGLRARNPPFSAEFPCWVNDSWFALSRTAVEAVCTYLAENPRFAEYYEHTVIPVESATATIVCNDPRLTVRNEALHHIRWSAPKTGRPDLLRVTDLDELAASGRPFARKFDPADTAVLDTLDERILGEPVSTDGPR